MFADSDAEQFIDRYRHATSDLMFEIQNLNTRVIVEMSNIDDALEEARTKLERDLGSIFENAENASFASDEAMSFGDETLSTVTQLDHELFEVRRDVERIKEIVEALMQHLQVEDPWLTRNRFFFKASVRVLLEAGAIENLEEFIQRGGAPNTGIPLETLEEWFQEVKDELGRSDE